MPVFVTVKDSIMAGLLKDIPPISIQAYSLETVVAEKFHAMIVRDVSNSRMKDFFDCYQVLTTRNLDDDVLYDAIKATFDNREIVYNPDLLLFESVFYNDKTRLSRWDSFLKKIQWKGDLSFEEVMMLITDRLHGLYKRYWEERPH